MKALDIIFTAIVLLFLAIPFGLVFFFLICVMAEYPIIAVLFILIGLVLIFYKEKK